MEYKVLDIHQLTVVVNDVSKVVTAVHVEYTEGTMKNVTTFEIPDIPTNDEIMTKITEKGQQLKQEWATPQTYTFPQQGVL